MSDQSQLDIDELCELECDAGSSDLRSIRGKDRVDADGYYHLSVLNLTVQKNTDRRITGVRLTLNVLGGDPANQAGAKFEHFINFEKKGGEEVADGVKRANARFFRAIGIATEEEMLSGTFTPRWKEATGKQFTGKVIVKDGRAQIDFGQVWAIGDEAALKIPCDLDALAECNYAIPQGQVASKRVELSFRGSASAPAESGDIPF